MSVLFVNISTIVCGKIFKCIGGRVICCCVNGKYSVYTLVHKKEHYIVSDNFVNYVPILTILHLITRFKF